MTTRVTEDARREPSFRASRGFSPPARCTALTKCEEKERLLAVYNVLYFKAYPLFRN